MARRAANHQGRDTSLTYKAAEQFRARCLMTDESLLFGEPVWTLPNLSRLCEKFVDAPDTSDRTFREKYKDQVQGEAQPVIRLAAEVLAVYFLFPSNVTAHKKRELVGEVLSWGGDTLPEGHLVHQAFAAGLGSGGQGYNTRRPDELALLIRFAIAWKQQNAEEARQRIQDPWLFEDFLREVEDADRRQLRHMLLHLLFPDYF
jgi:5-methylcytosine-specific restriction protein B